MNFEEMMNQRLKEGRIEFDDDLVIVKKGRKVIYQGEEDYEPMKDEPWEWDGKKYILPGGYIKKLLRRG